MITKTKRFYATKSAVHAPGILGLYSEAVETAKQRLAQSSGIDEYYIVEVIAVVKREQPPVIVEKVRRS